MSNPLRARYDLIINGGGIVGFTLLNLLNKSPSLRRCKVLLIEQAKKPTSLKQPLRVQESSTASGWDDSSQDRAGSEKNFSNRVSSITLSSKQALREIDVWDHVSRYTKDVSQIKVWNYDYTDKIVFKQVAQTAKGDRNVMFSVVENNRLSLALIEAMSKRLIAQDAVSWDSTLSHFGGSPTKGLVDVTIRNVSSDEEIQVSAPLVVGCDGFKSKVRELIGMQYREFDLNKTAVVGTVRMATTPDSDGVAKNEVAYQRFSSDKDTVAALLPLDSEYSSFVISAPNDYAKHLVECDEETFTHEFNRLLSGIEIPSNTGLRTLHDVANMAMESLHSAVLAGLSRFKPDLAFERNTCGFEDSPRIESTIKDSRALLPLYFGTTSPKMVAPLPGNSNIQIALLGDSAHRVHPLAGQGLNLGIQDAMELVKQLETIARSGENVFGENDQSALEKALKRYECKRQTYIIPMSAGILSMPYLFKFMPSKMVSAINRCEPVKQTSVRFANGC